MHRQRCTGLSNSGYTFHGTTVRFLVIPIPKYCTKRSGRRTHNLKIFLMRLRSSIRSRSIALSLVESSSLRFLELYRSTKTSRDTIESDGFSVHEYEVPHDSSQTIITLPHPSISFPSIYYRPTAKNLAPSCDTNHDRHL
jgi:hypothetical protein